MTLHFAPYLEQVARWPASGRHILAQYDDSTIIVYQAFNPAIGLFAIEHQWLGGEFKYGRMSWIKPNFLWMMYRSGWGVKPGQEIVLAIRISRAFFESVLAQAAPSAYAPDLYPNKEAWKADVARSEVRLQWDPDHHPSGEREARRAIQLGLRGEVLREFGRRAIIEIIDMTEFVRSQRVHVEAGDYHLLMTPREDVYIPTDPAVSARLKLDSFDDECRYGPLYEGELDRARAWAKPILERYEERRR